MCQSWGLHVASVGWRGAGLHGMDVCVAQGAGFPVQNRV